jgi:hypothetical protein
VEIDLLKQLSDPDLKYEYQAAPPASAVGQVMTGASKLTTYFIDDSGGK